MLIPGKSYSKVLIIQSRDSIETILTKNLPVMVRSHSRCLTSGRQQQPLLYCRIHWLIFALPSLTAVSGHQQLLMKVIPLISSSIPLQELQDCWSSALSLLPFDGWRLHYTTDISFWECRVNEHAHLWARRDQQTSDERWWANIVQGCASHLLTRWLPLNVGQLDRLVMQADCSGYVPMAWPVSFHLSVHPPYRSSRYWSHYAMPADVRSITTGIILTALDSRNLRNSFPRIEKKFRVSTVVRLLNIPTDTYIMLLCITCLSLISIFIGVHIWWCWCVVVCRCIRQYSCRSRWSWLFCSVICPVSFFYIVYAQF